MEDRSIDRLTSRLEWGKRFWDIFFESPIMVQSVEGLNESQINVKSLIESILETVMKIVEERTDVYFDSFANFKIKTCGNEAVLDCDLPKGESFELNKGSENEGMSRVNSIITDICYPSLADLPEVLVHSSMMSTSSKHGEGDYQPLMRETRPFHHLEENGLQQNNGCRSHSITSLNTETSNDELITSLHNDIYTLSFDNIHLSNSEADDEDGLQMSSSSPDAELLLKSSLQELYEPDESSNIQNVVQHSQKFFQINNTKNFPFNSLPADYCQLVDQSYDKYHPENEMEEQEISSGSSKEMVMIDGDLETSRSSLNVAQSNPFRNSGYPFLCSQQPSMMAFSVQHSPRADSEKSAKELNTITVVADVESARNWEWEEAMEVQVNVTEPDKNVNRGYVEKNSDMIHTRQFMSNVGLMTEQRVDPKYLGPVNYPGIESIPGVTQVKERPLEFENQYLETPNTIWVTEPQDLIENYENEISQDENDASSQEDESLNYLSFPDKTETRKKKKRFISRLARAIRDIFKTKKKSFPADEH